MKKWIIIPILCAINICAALAQGTGFVRLDGRQFKDENGNDFYPICMNYGLQLIYDNNSGAYYFAPNSHYGVDQGFECSGSQDCFTDIEQDLQLIKDMGFNTIHLWGCSPQVKTQFGFFIETWENVQPWWNTPWPPAKHYFNIPFSPNDPVIQTMFQFYNDVCDYAYSIGLKVIIDGQMNDGFGYPSGVTDYSDYLSLFSSHMNSPLLTSNAKKAFMAYVLMGEPYYAENGPGLLSKEEICEQTKIWYDVINGNDPNHLICSGGMSFFEVMEFDPSIVKMDFYFPHFYPERKLHEDISSGTPNYTATIDRIKGTIWWLGKNCPLPWMVGETGFAATDGILKDELNGTLQDQHDYFDDVLEWVRNCGGSGLAIWQFQEVWWDDGNFQDGLGLLRHGDTQDPQTLPGLKKPGLTPFANYLVNGQPPSFQPVFQPANYYDPYNHETYNPNKINAVSGNIIDQNGKQVKDAVIEAVNWLRLYDKGTIDPDDDEHQHSWIYTFSNADYQPSNFEIIPYSPYFPNDPKIVYIRCSATGASRIEEGQDFPWTDLQMQTSVGTKVLDRIETNYDSEVENLTITIGSAQQSFTGWNSLSLSNVTFDQGATGELTARSSIDLHTEFHAKSGSELHVFNSKVFPECSDYTGFLRSSGNLLTVEGINRRNKNIELEFEQMSERDIDAIIFPNPNTGRFTLKLNGEINHHLLNISVKSAIGNQIENYTTNGRETTIEIQNKEPGIYFVEIFTTASNSIVKKLIIN